MRVKAGTRFLWIAVALCMCGIGGNGMARGQRLADKIFPPEIDNAWTASMLEQQRFKPLWTPVAIVGYETRYRLTYHGILTTAVIVQIDRISADRARLTAIVTLRNRMIERRVFRLSTYDMAELEASANNSGLWTIYPEYWVPKDKNDICIDGMEAIIERRDAKGYRYSQGNTSCYSSTGMNRLAEKMIELARLRTRTAWFPWSK